MIGEKIHEALLKAYEKEGKRDYVGISQMGYCALKVMRQYENSEKQKLSSDTLLKFLTGSATHEKLQALLWKERGELKKFTWIKKEGEVEINTPAGYKMKGHYDLLAQIDGAQTVVDFKIIADGYFKIIKEPQQHYKDQLYLYAYGLGIESCLLIYINKDTGDFKEFSFTVDNDRVQYLLDKYDAIMSKNIDDLKFNIPEDTWECKYCDYAKDCPYSVNKKAPKKTDEVMSDDPALDEILLEYKRLNEEAKVNKEALDDLKKRIEEALGGSDYETDFAKVTYVAPKVSKKYPVAKLRKLVAPEILEQIEEEKETGGYYTIKFNVTYGCNTTLTCDTSIGKKYVNKNRS